MQPKKPQEITPEWINYAFSEAGICNSGAIRDVKVEPLGPHVKGLLSSICRVRITYEPKEPELPASVVIKFPPEIEQRKKLRQSIPRV